MKKLLLFVLLVVLVVGAGALAVVSLRVGPAPEVQISPSARAIGMRGSVLVTATAGGRGLAGLRVEVEQKGRTTVVARAVERPRAPWSFRGPRRTREELHADVGRNAVPDLAPGEAIVRVVAERAPTWLRHPDPVVKELKLPVRLVAPALSLLSTQHYVAQGGSGVVVYRVADTATRDGVRCGPWFFPGHPLPGGSGERFAIFGVPWDMGDDKAIRLLAEDDAGNTSEIAFVDQFFPKPPRLDTVQLQDEFLNRVVGEIMAQTPGLADRGSVLENYLQINRDLRARQATELAELSRRSEPRFLWTQPFLPLHNAQVMASFADQRTYFYGGKEVDKETHLGFDLAVTAQTPVTAANRGVVKLARYFGIYGNTVVLDHGFGLMTLYAHLSWIGVKEGDQVERGGVLGRTGRTGLAGGDHLHFTTLVGGVPVRPTEWWDPHWIHDRVAVRLAPAVSFEGVPVAAKAE
ncbi:MAG TPA: M23 family metallopeptidase [Vicinamibacteria bacterium]|nr:M23 family metallopeptidase [Vicinamibacteria bacterium]